MKNLKQRQKTHKEIHKLSKKSNDVLLNGLWGIDRWLPCGCFSVGDIYPVFHTILGGCYDDPITFQHRGQRTLKLEQNILLLINSKLIFRIISFPVDLDLDE